MATMAYRQRMAFLRRIYDRLVTIHGEPEDVDYMVRLRDLARLRTCPACGKTFQAVGRARYDTRQCSQFIRDRRFIARHPTAKRDALRATRARKRAVA